MTRSPEQLLRGQHFYAGLRIAMGLIGLSLGVYCFAGVHAAAISASGGICTSVADTISPSRHKPREILAGWLVSSCMYFLIGMIRPMPVVLGVVLMVASFFIALSAVFGPKAGPVGFAGTFAIIMSFGMPSGASVHLASSVFYFTLGGALYLFYSTLSARFLAFRTKQQMLAECSFELARYLRIKSSLYEKLAPLDYLYHELLRQQSILAARQQETREFLFRDLKEDRDYRLAEVFIRQVDFFEHILASNTDYELLHQYYSGNDVMLFLRDLVYKSAKGIEHVAYAALRNTIVPSKTTYKAEIFAIEHSLERLVRDKEQNQSALSTLFEAYDKIAVCTEMVEEIQRVQSDQNYKYDAAVSLKLSLFTTSFNYNLRLLRKNLNFRSPFLRHAIRAAIAMELGYLATFIPNHFTSDLSIHSYWIMLNISVVLRSNFSMTAQRRGERIVGSAFGCLLTAVILYMSPSIGAILVCLFVSQVAITTFLNIDYRVTSAAASVLTLLQIHMLDPTLTFALGERLVDTVVGALLAYFCSFIFPSWEYNSLPKLIDILSSASAKYTAVVLGCKDMDEEYRLARRSMLNAVSELSATLERIRHEPANRRRAVKKMGRFITLNYLFAARMASIRILLSRLAGCSAQDVIRPELDAVMGKMSRLLSITAKEEPATAGNLCQPSGGEPHFEKSMSATLENMDYFVQHVVESLHKQLDFALLLAAEIQSFRRILVEEYKSV